MDAAVFTSAWMDTAAAPFLAAYGEDVNFAYHHHQKASTCALGHPPTGSTGSENIFLGAPVPLPGW